MSRRYAGIARNTAIAATPASPPMITWRIAGQPVVSITAPQAAAKRQEEKERGEPDDRGVVVKETVPADVFDRLDRRNSDAGVDGAAPAAPAPEPPEHTEP